MLAGLLEQVLDGLLPLARRVRARVAPPACAPSQARPRIALARRRRAARAGRARAPTCWACASSAPTAGRSPGGSSAAGVSSGRMPCMRAPPPDTVLARPSPRALPTDRARCSDAGACVRESSWESSCCASPAGLWSIASRAKSAGQGRCRAVELGVRCDLLRLAAVSAAPAGASSASAGGPVAVRRTRARPAARVSRSIACLDALQVGGVLLLPALDRRPGMSTRLARTRAPRRGLAVHVLERLRGRLDPLVARRLPALVVAEVADQARALHERLALSDALGEQLVGDRDGDLRASSYLAQACEPRARRRSSERAARTAGTSARGCSAGTSAPRAAARARRCGSARRRPRGASPRARGSPSPPGARRSRTASRARAV